MHTEVQPKIMAYLSFLFFVHLATATTSASLTLSNETDRQALLAIKDQIDDPFQALSSWNDSLHFCQWQGINCSSSHQRVIDLNLLSLSLSGTLSPYIGNLSFLRTIDLGNNHFRGAIPQEIGHLTRLRQLVLENNSFEGYIPANLSQCSKLEILNLDSNGLIGEIPAKLGSLSSLTQLRVVMNNFTGFIPPAIGNLSNLCVLSLSWNNLEGNIPEDLRRLANLRYFSLSVNNLSGEVPIGLYNISSLTVFSVPCNSLQGSLPPDLFSSLPNIQQFFIGSNKFSGPIPKSLANASSLLEISISFNHLSGPLPLNLGNIQNLVTLQLNMNPVFATSKKVVNYQFLRALTNCTKLNNLNLAQTNFTGEFPDSITNLSSQLTILGIEENFISGSIPTGIGNLVNLIYLNMDANMLSGNIPDSIGKLTNLQALALAWNKLSGEIPSSIGNLTSLSELYLDDNMLEGSIPVSLGDCNFLNYINLAHNNLTGEVPEQVLSLFSLSSSLILAYNKLTGPLPPEVGSLKNIPMILLEENELSGEIPSTLGSCTMLEVLGLGGNHFEGSIPSSFEQLRGIQSIDLSHNNLSGKIPDFLGNLSYLAYLDLSFNDLEGQVPDVGIFSNSSAFFIAGNQKLCGGIRQLQLPPCPKSVPIKTKKHKAHAVVAVATVGAVVCSIILSAIIYLRWRLRSRIPSPVTQLVSQYKDFSYGELAEATDQFSSSNLMGQGSFGSVYKGSLKTDGEIVAVKVFNLDVHGATKSFFAECEALKNIRHRNLVKIITSCSSMDYRGNEFKALVYEFMPNGNLDSWLHPNLSTNYENPRNLNLIQRLNVAIDVGNAIEYLHHQCHEPVVHCDLKSSNVLLDSNLVAHVGDFGLARLLVATANSYQSQTCSTSNGMRGTFGYMAPEYGMCMQVSTKGDMYSYGIILLEMFTGKRPIDSAFNDNLGLHGYVEYALLNDQVMEVVDSRLLLDEEAREVQNGIANVDSAGATTSNHEIKGCLTMVFQIGVKCSAESPRERMEIRDALKELLVARKLLDRRE